MLRFLLVCAGGALGSGTRYLVGLASLRLVGPSWPLGTLTVNVVGCFLMALVSTIAVAVPPMNETTRVVLTGGFLGGLTTYSAFNQESVRLLVERPGVGLGYLAVTVATCLLAGAGGTWAGRALAL